MNTISSTPEPTSPSTPILSSTQASNSPRTMSETPLSQRDKRKYSVVEYGIEDITSLEIQGVRYIVASGRIPREASRERTPWSQLSDEAAEEAVSEAPMSTPPATQHESGNNTHQNDQIDQGSQEIFCVAQAGQADPAPEYPLPGPIQAIMSSLTSTAYADLILICDDRRWKCHRVVVCPQSQVLESLMKVGEGANQHLYTIDLNTFNPTAIDKMVGYFYTGSFFYDSSSPSCGIDLLVPIYSLASKLCLDGLAILTRQYYAQQLHHIESLPHFFSSIKEIYSSTPTTDRGLRDIVVEAVVGELSVMIAEPAIRQNLMDFMAGCRDFWADVMSALGMAFDQRRPPLVCSDCGPNEEGYEIDVGCRKCGGTGRIVLN